MDLHFKLYNSICLNHTEYSDKELKNIQFQVDHKPKECSRFNNAKKTWRITDRKWNYK
jgi:hypothetical protein